MKYHRSMIIIAIILVSANMSIFCTHVYAFEQRPNVNKIFSEEKEAQIVSLKSLQAIEVFDKLKSSDYMINRDLSYKAIYEAFTNRRVEAISLAQSYLMLPLIEVVDDRPVSRGRDFNIAKKIFKVFPDEATPILVTLYNRSDEITRGNIIQASGGVAGGPPIKDMLINALDDKFFAEEVAPEMLGEPLRVCDIAYNQIVLRYRVRNVLRTITSSHKIETRDYHINILKSSSNTLN